MDGILNIDKPYGMTSMEVVRRIKKASGLKHVGHAGTLDPVATGVVPICLGQATRVMEYIVDGTKEYRAVIELGETTDTYDALGKVTGKRDPSYVTLADVERALEPLKGRIQQVPPMFSALKRGGRRLYDLARAGIEVERAPRWVEVFDIELVAWSPPQVTLQVSCGRGLYMRTLAYDLGEAVGCGAHLKGLVRLRSGPFKITEAISIAEAAQRFEDGSWRDVTYTPDVVLHKLRAAIVGRRLEDMIRHGRPIPALPRTLPSHPDELCRVYGVDGGFLAILAFDATLRQWQPHKVFSLS